MKTYLSWSGGKDSSASIALCYEKGIPLDGVIFSEVMFDNSRNISGENPEHIAFVHNAIKTINRMGYNCIILRHKYDYLHEFNRRVGYRAKPNYVGKESRCGLRV